MNYPACKSAPARSDTLKPLSEQTVVDGTRDWRRSNEKKERRTEARRKYKQGDISWDMIMDVDSKSGAA